MLGCANNSIWRTSCADTDYLDIIFVFMLLVLIILLVFIFSSFIIVVVVVIVLLLFGIVALWASYCWFIAVDIG